MGGTGSERAGQGVSDAAAADPDATDEVEAAGRFRIYLGAAPGVGKTYAMLSEGHRRQERGAPTSSLGSSRPMGGRPPKS